MTSQPPSLPFKNHLISKGKLTRQALRNRIGPDTETNEASTLGSLGGLLYVTGLKQISPDGNIRSRAILDIS